MVGFDLLFLDLRSHFGLGLRARLGMGVYSGKIKNRVKKKIKEGGSQVGRWYVGERGGE